MPPKRKRAAPAPAAAASAPDAAVEAEPVAAEPGAEPPLKRRSSRGISKQSSEATAVPEFEAPPPPVPTAKAKPARKGKAKIEKPETPNRIKQEANGDDVPPEPEETPSKKKKQPHKSSIAAKKANEEIKAFKAEQAEKKAAAAAANPAIKKEGDADKEVAPDPEAMDEVAEDIETVKLEAARPPPVNSEYLPLPWKGRLGYACLNTYLRTCNPPIFNSRTCRIASILAHRHPLQDPSQPEHPTKNRPDTTQPADIERGKRYVEELGLANVRDIPKILRWNDKYGIKFFRLSSEMFPFASHDEYGYKLAPFASEALAEAGKVAAELGHRLTTHPGQFTQLGSPRQAVIDNAIRDLEVHDEMLTLLKLPPQQDRDAIMVLHLGGTFGDKGDTVARFKENYKKLPESIKNRLVLENDDVAWSVHDLLPICEELNIPLVLDFHHHNIIFDSKQLREGTKDIMELFPRIIATWTKKGKTPKMHYSEPCPEAVTGRQRRKHNPRPLTLPPCPDTMDLMIEAKDKEQAVFELMRTFKLPGWDTFNNIIPYEREDDNREAVKRAKKKKTKKQIKEEIDEYGYELPETPEEERMKVPDGEIGMGGPENRVYWPVGMEEWLVPKKREIKKKGVEEDDLSQPTPYNFAARRELKIRDNKPLDDELKAKIAEAETLAALNTVLEEVKTQNREAAMALLEVPGKKKPAANGGGSKKNTPKKAAPKREATPDFDDKESDELTDLNLSDGDDDGVPNGTSKPLPAVKKERPVGRRAAAAKKVSYAEVVADEDDD